MKNKRKPRIQLWAEKNGGVLDLIMSQSFWDGMVIGFTITIIIAAIGMYIYIKICG